MDLDTDKFICVRCSREMKNDPDNPIETRKMLMEHIKEHENQFKISQFYRKGDGSKIEVGF